MSNIIRPRHRIFVIRGQKVMLDSDLAALYRVTAFNLNKAVKRNIKRFPADFMFRLTEAEFANLRFQNGISSSKHGGRRYRPHMFTEMGVAMLSSVLRSETAIRANIGIMRAFAALRNAESSHTALAHKIIELERKYDGQFRDVFEAIRDIVQTPIKKTPCIGFKKA